MKKVGRNLQSAGLNIGYVATGPHAFVRLSGQFGPQQLILCWPVGPVAFRSVANACSRFYVDLSRAAVRWLFSSTNSLKSRHRKQLSPHLDMMN